MTALMMIEVNTMKVAQQQWVLAENAVIECKKSIGSPSSVSERDCIIEPIQTHVWKMTSKSKPSIEVYTYVDPISGQTTRLNWRQAFE